jgi:hypothetical protein
MNQKRLRCGLSASLGERLDGQAEAPSLAYLEVGGVGGALLLGSRGGMERRKGSSIELALAETARQDGIRHAHALLLMRGDGLEL